MKGMNALKNIYDIIAEQKCIVDINMTSYGLNYLFESVEYINEGFGESIQNFGKKVVEFIKSIIQKIKELVRNVISFFRKSQSNINEINKEIEDINAEYYAGGGDGGGNSEDKPKKKDKEEPPKQQPRPEPPKREEPPKQQPRPEQPKPKKKPEIKNDIEAVLMTTDIKYNGTIYGDISKRMSFLSLMIGYHDSVYKEIAISIKNNDGKRKGTDYRKLLDEKLFKNPDASLPEMMREALDDGDPEHATNINVQHYTKIILGYLRNGEDFIKRIQNAERDLVGKCEKLIADINSNRIAPSADASEAQIKEMYYLAHSVTLNLGMRFDHLLKSTTRAHSQYLKIANKAKERYKQMVLGAL